MTTEKEDLTPGRLEALYQIVEMSRDGIPVCRIVDGQRMDATARYLCDETGAFWVHKDVRDMFLRVRLEGGLYDYWPVSDLMDDIVNKTFWRKSNGS